MSVKNRIGLAMTTGLFGLSLTGCTEPSVQQNVSRMPASGSPGTIALVSFFASPSAQSGERLVRVPGFDGYIRVGEIAPEGLQTVTSLFRKKLVASGYALVPQEEVEKALRSLRRLEEKPRVLAQKLARRLGADSVLMGWVFRYRERVGNAWGAQQPASVAFVALLFDGKDGTLLWQGRFDETQQALSVDILRLSSFVRRGGRWLTARQLAADGVTLLVMGIPGEKKSGVER